MTLEEKMFKHKDKISIVMLMFWMMWTVYLSAHLGREVYEGDVVWTIGYMVMIVVSMSFMFYQYFPFHMYVLTKDNKNHSYIWGKSVYRFVPKDEEKPNP